MPDITLRLTRQDSVNAFSLMHLLGGGAGQKEQRAAFQRAIMDAWPEITDAAAATDPGEKRKIPFTSKQQRAVAEGILTFCNDTTIRGGDYTAARSVAEACRLDGWIKDHIVALPAQDFEGALDGEPDLIDPPKEDAVGTAAESPTIPPEA